MTTTRISPTKTRRTFSSRLGDALLVAAAIIGGLCIVLTVAGLLFGYSLIMFRTGSMAPTIPAGSVALVHEIPAAQITVGDIVTVDREDELPITHRVISVDEGPRTTEREIRMKGDANKDPDATSYVIESARLVKGSVPGMAQTISTLSTPMALGAMTLAATALVAWAFWPKTTRRAGASRDGAESTGSAD